MRGLSLRAKVFLMFAATSLLIVAPALLLMAQAVERGVYERAREELVRAPVPARQWDFPTTCWPAAPRWAATPWPAALACGNVRRRRRLMEWELLQRAPQGHRHRRGQHRASVFGPKLDARAIASAGGAGTPSWRSADGGGPAALRAGAGAGTTAAAAGAGGVGRPAGRGRGSKRTWAGAAEVVLIVGDSLVGTTLSDSAQAAAQPPELRLLALAAPPRGRSCADQAYMAAP